MKNKKLTPAQTAILTHTASGVSVRTSRNPGQSGYKLVELPDDLRDLRVTDAHAERLYVLGLLNRRALSMYSAEYTITEAGRAVL